jgi:hypothetical protein
MKFVQTLTSDVTERKIVHHFDAPDWQTAAAIGEFFLKEQNTIYAASSVITYADKVFNDGDLIWITSNFKDHDDIEGVFLADDEGWAHVRFADGSKTSVRPSRIRPRRVKEVA